MADFNSDTEFKNMRSDAILRAQQMQMRSQNYQSEEIGSDISEASCSTDSSKTEQPRTYKKPQQSGGFINDIFARLGIKGGLDSDKIVIILLIIILAREGADLKLLLALGYILM